MYDWSIVGNTVHTVSNVHLLLRMTTGYIMQKVAFSTCLRLLPTFVGVLPEKICTRASFTTILANYISEEYSILGCFWRFQNFFSMETLSWTFEFSYVKQKKNWYFWASEDGKFVNNGGTVVLLLLDLSAAFDTVDHSILLDRLKMRFGIKGRVLAWFKLAPFTKDLRMKQFKGNFLLFNLSSPKQQHYAIHVKKYINDSSK